MSIRVLILTNILIPILSFGQVLNKDYTNYHKGVIDAEYQFFVKKDFKQGLKIFKQTFDSYEFVFVDDCIEAFQLALFFKQEDYATQFIKKALENGFELKLLDNLSPGCTCNFFAEAKQKVTIHESYIKKNKTFLEAYSKSCYNKYIQRIDKNLLSEVLKRHVEEQLFKDYPPWKQLNIKDPYDDIQKKQKDYVRITENNLHFIDSLASEGVFLGEKNLGIYTNKLAENINLSFGTIENYLGQLLKEYGLNETTYVPINGEVDYFRLNPLYNMLFHNLKSYDVLAKYKDEAIKLGFMHPKEFASLKYSRNNIPQETNLYLQPNNNKKLEDTKKINALRKWYLLPTYESDYYKHVFAHEHHLQLFFGYFNGTN